MEFMELRGIFYVSLVYYTFFPVRRRQRVRETWEKVYVVKTRVKL
jgi:hypothetical protein